jgi:hypothetical protein
MTADPEEYDTPTNRATITQLHVDELDTWLTRIRERRLTRVKQLEAAAKVKSDSVRLDAFIKLERAMVAAKRALEKLEEQDAKTEKLVHKCRLLAMAAQLEVGIEEDADSEVA